MRRFAIAQVCLLLLLAPGRAAAESGLTGETRAEYETALSLLADPTRENVENAYARLNSAYSRSHAWQLLSQLAFAAAALERPGEAIRAYQSFLREGGAEIDAEERARIERDLAALVESTAWVKLRILDFPGEAELSDTRSDPKPTTNTYKLTAETTELGLSPGRHELQIFAGGHSKRLTVELLSGTHREERVSLSATSPTRVPPVFPVPATPVRAKPERTTETPQQGSWVPFYVSGSITGGLLAATILTGVAAVDQHAKYERVNDGRDPNRAAALRDTGTQLNLLTDGLIGLTALGSIISAAIYQHALHPEIRRTEPPPKPRRRSILGIQLSSTRGLTPNFVALRGQF